MLSESLRRFVGGNGCSLGEGPAHALLISSGRAAGEVQIDLGRMDLPAVPLSEAPAAAPSNHRGNGAAPAPNKLQAARRELKFDQISEAKAAAIRAFIRCYLPPDQYTLGREGIGYHVHSLYFDSAGLTTFYDTEYGRKNRFKLRVRFYEDDENSPVFLEVKSRNTDIIGKTRAKISRAAAGRLVEENIFPRVEDLIDPDPKNIDGLFNFWRFWKALEARPAVYTSYLREGYEPEDSNVVRVTFDRDIRAGPFNGRLEVGTRAHWPPAAIQGVVLELKFTERYPNWMEELVQSFDLTRTSVPKYIQCVHRIKGDRPYLPRPQVARSGPR